MHIERRFEPNMENHATYMKLYEDWRKMCARELQIADDRITRYMGGAGRLTHIINHTKGRKQYVYRKRRG